MAKMQKGKKFVLPYDEYEPYEVHNSVLFAEIAGELNYQRKKRMEERDIALRDFSYPFRGTTDNWTVPQSHLQEYFNAYTKAQRKDWSAVAGGVNFHVSESGGLVLQQGIGSIIVIAEQLAEFVDATNTALVQIRAMNPFGTTQAVLSQNEKVANCPENAVNKRRNEERMAYSLKVEKKRQDDLMYSGLARLERLARGW